MPRRSGDCLRRRSCSLMAQNRTLQAALPPERPQLRLRNKTSVPPINPTVTGKGVAGFVPVWDTTSDIVDSVMFQKSSQIGFGTTSPTATIDVNGKGNVRDTLTLFPKSTDNTLAVSGTAFKISSTGTVTFI